MDASIATPNVYCNGQLDVNKLFEAVMNLWLSAKMKLQALGGGQRTSEGAAQELDKIRQSSRSMFDLLDLLHASVPPAPGSSEVAPYPYQEERRIFCQLATLLTNQIEVVSAATLL